MTQTDTDKSQALSAVQVSQKIRRIAYEIYENNFKEKVIILAGIDGQGFLLAEMIGKELQSISPLDCQIVRVSLDKLAPQQSEVTVDCEEKAFKKKMHCTDR